MHTRITFLLLLLLCTQLANTQTNPLRMFIFGHSLLDHRPPINPTPSDETTVPHWLHLLSQEAGYDYFAGGQYGFLPQHANLPPISQWGYDIVAPVWESDTETFGEADINTVLITAGNFMQWQPADEDYPGNPGVSPVSATEDILDWLMDQGDNPRCYIYENWPDMAPYLGSGFPPTETEFAQYNSYTTGDFHTWWLDYQDFLLQSRPAINVRMIPVGPIMSGLHTGLLADQIPYTELYEDDAPHGRASTYFLAALITYMAIYEEPAPLTYSVPTIVHQTIRDNYSAIVNFAWSELQNFNDDMGTSRVFYSTVLPAQLTYFDAEIQDDGIHLSWGALNETLLDTFEIEHSTDAVIFETIGLVPARLSSGGEENEYNFLHESPVDGWNYYRLRQQGVDGTYLYSDVIASATSELAEQKLLIYPNPSADGRFFLNLTDDHSARFELSLYDLNGRVVWKQYYGEMAAGSNLALDFQHLPGGVYTLQLISGSGVATVSRIMF